MKASFYICDTSEALAMPVKGSEYLKEVNTWNHIKSKMRGKFFDLPFNITKEMIVNLTVFDEEYDFEGEEFDLIDSDGYFAIDSLVVFPTHVEVWLSKDAKEK